MRAIIIIVIAAVLGFFGYQYAVNGRAPAEAVSVLTGEAARQQAEAEAAAAQAAAEAEAAAAEAEAAAEAAQQAALQEAEEAAAAAEQAAATAAAEAEAAAQAAAEEAAAAAEAVMEGTSGAAEEAVEAATEAASEAAEAVAEAADAAEEAMTDGTQAATTNDIMEQSDELLTVEGFNADRVLILIENADIPEEQKATLTNAVNTAKENPVLLQPVLDQIRQFIGQ
ncbi:hypothetical protein [Yoonia sp.]|uniref:hypothetical protein n=1 Tax=Yoonia sp. TaxID=2212373 RepID=UPI003F6B9147